MKPFLEISADQSAPTRWGWAAAEVVLIVALFFLAAGSSPPAVNEAHYLAKAAHAWQPSWCAGDLFLESADAHLVFQTAFGWVTCWLSLAATAWVGRVLTWLLLAWAWRQLSVAVVPWRMMSLVTAGLMLLLSERMQMAGEWIVGGVEAKGLAFALVLAALALLIRGRWQFVWPVLGAASSFHVLVGGWSVVAAAAAWLSDRRQCWRWLTMLPSLMLGLLLALPGLAPAVLLTWRADPDTVRQANQIYVFQRLPHHLVFHQFPPQRIACHVTLLTCWLVLCWIVPQSDRLRRLNRFVAGAVAIAVIGVLIDGITVSRPEIAAALLRFYWFRLSDVMLPVGTALAIAAFIARWDRSRPRLAACAVSLVLLAGVVNVAWDHYGWASDPRPRGDFYALPRFPHDPQRTADVDRDWRNVCQWIEQHTEPGDVVLTPRYQQTFKWYAQRAEVVSWKDIPQDAAGIVEWWARIQEIHTPQAVRWGLAAHSDQQLSEFARKYGAKYVLIDETRWRRKMSFARVYPNAIQRNLSYSVYRITLNPPD